MPSSRVIGTKQLAARKYVVGRHAQSGWESNPRHWRCKLILYNTRSDIETAWLLRGREE